MAEGFYVKAIWDPDPGVWVSESDIPGLVIETETLAEFEEVMDVLAPEMLAENLGIHARRKWVVTAPPAAEKPQ